MTPADFRNHGRALVEWIADYLTGSERYPVLPRVSPGDVRRAQPAAAPQNLRRCRSAGCTVCWVYRTGSKASFRYCQVEANGRF